MTFLRDSEVLVQRKVKTESGWTHNRIPARVAELVYRLQDKRRGVEPLLRSRCIQSCALAGRVRTVISDIRVSAIHASRRIYREPSSPGCNASHLPSPRNGIKDAVPDIHPATLTEGQIVQSRYHQAMAIVEG